MKGISLNTVSNVQSVFWLSFLGSGFLPNNLLNMDINNIIEIFGGSGIVMSYLFNNQIYNITNEVNDIADNYNQVIENTAKLFRELKLNNPLEIFSVYNYMLRRGDFSYNNEFLYSEKSKDINILGSDVIAGNGVCRHISSMLNDLYNKLDYEAYNLIVYAPKDLDNNIKPINKKYLLTDMIPKQSHNINLLSSIKLGNHQVNLINDNNINYIFDPTNDTIFDSVTDKKLALKSNNDYEVFMRYLKTNIIGQNSKEELKRIKELLLNNNKMDDEYLESYSSGLFKAKFNSDLIKDYVANNYEYYYEIKKLLDSIPSMSEREFINVPMSLKRIK